jgi:hypothetical protein
MKSVKIKIGDTVQKLEALEKTEDGTIYICRETGEMYLGRLEEQTDKIVNTSCVKGSDFTETSFSPGLAILGKMVLRFTRIYYNEDGEK